MSLRAELRDPTKVWLFVAGVVVIAIGMVYRNLFRSPEEVRLP